MANDTLIDLRNTRLQKIAQLRQMGINPYPATSQRTHLAKQIHDNFEQVQGQRAVIAGRMMSWRKQGALAFINLQDPSDQPIQLFLRKTALHPTDAQQAILGYGDLGLVDVGDIIEAEGEIKKTERGTVSIMVEKFRLLAKSLRPLPEKWSGLKDREIIVRKRYLDAITQPEVKQRYAQIAKMLSVIRRFLEAQGFIEILTPIIQPQYGGGMAQPFKTQVHALHAEMYLAISHELYLKRLIAAGYDKVYTIGRYFRNEGIDKSHHPEFSMVETMTAYENYEYNMNLVEDLFRTVAVEAFGKTEFKVRGHAVDFSQPWRRLSMTAAVLAETGIDFGQLQALEQARAALLQLGIHEAADSIGNALVLAFAIKVEPTLIQPTLIYGHPVEISPLAKPMSQDSRYAERFEIFIGGMECGDNWSEQNDPVHLLETWRRYYDPSNPDSGDFHSLDFDFIEAIEHGIPPTTGIGPGIERMAMIFTEQEHIDDVIFFPLRRRAISPANADIYGIKATDEEG